MIPRTVQMAAAVAAQFTSTQLNDYGNIILNGYTTTTPGVTTAGAVGSLASVTVSSGGTGYTAGTYNGVFISGAKGNYAYGTVTVTGTAVTGVTITSGGQGFVVGSTVGLALSPGNGAQLTVDSVDQTQVNPVLKGWTTNYQEYYTQLQPNGYRVNPGDPTMFEYTVHSYTPANATGPVALVSVTDPGSGYTPGTYPAETLTGGSGTGATANITVSNEGGPATAASLVTGGSGYPAGAILSDASTTTLSGSGTGLLVNVSGGLGSPFSCAFSGIGTNAGTGYQVGDTVTPIFGAGTGCVIRVDAVTATGSVETFSIVNPGTGYKPGDTLSAALPGGSDFAAYVSAIQPPIGQSAWAQPPRRLIQNQVLPGSPNSSINNPAAIPYSAILYPVQDNQTPPPIDIL